MKLDKVLKTRDIMIVAFSAMIGWSWVVNTGIWIEGAGVLGAILAFILGGIMVLFVSLTYAELTPAIPETGGELIFTLRAMGPTLSFICAWGLLLAYIGVVAFEACAFPTVVFYIFPGLMKGYMYTVAGFDIYATWVLVGAAVTILIAAVNILGLRTSANFQAVFFTLILAAAVIIACISLTGGTAQNVAVNMFSSVEKGGHSALGGILTIMVMTPFMFVGFDVVPQVAQETIETGKKMGKIIISSVVMAIAFYSLIIFMTGYGLSPAMISKEEMSGNSLIVADMLSFLTGHPWIGKLVIIGGLSGILTSWNAFMIGASRVLFAMANLGMIPAVFGKTHKKFNTPANAILLVGAVTVFAPFFGRRMLVWLTDAGGFGTCLAYLMVSLSFLILRKKEPDLYRPYRVRHGETVGIAAVVFSGLFIFLYLIPLPFSSSALNLQEWIIVGGWTILGIIFYFYGKAKKVKKV